jgi:hypothetical protein
LSAAAVADQAERAALIARCIEIARECLEGDPFREVPRIERVAGECFEQLDGGDPHDVRVRGKPAYMVASSALNTAALAGRDYAYK